MNARERPDRIPCPVTVLRDLQYAAPGGVPLLADLFLPQGGGTPAPVLVWIHGGGWRFGNRRLAPDLTRYFACRGFAMVSIDYRLSTQARFPAQIEDLKTAIRWIRAVASTHALDGERIGLLGASAGGHLAALAGLSPCGPFDVAGPHADRRADVQAVVDAYGPTDFLQMDGHRPPGGTPCDDPETLLLPPGVTASAQPDSFESLLLGAPIGSVPERVHAANPVAYARPGAPPFLILHGTADTTVPVHQSLLLYDALAAYDNDVTLGLIDGLGHGFLNRTHLDDGPLRRMTLKRHVPGSGAWIESVRQPVFGAIEAFFRAALGLRPEGSAPAAPS